MDNGEERLRQKALEVLGAQFPEELRNRLEELDRLGELKGRYQSSLGSYGITRDPFHVEVYDISTPQGQNCFYNSHQFGQVSPASGGRQFKVFERGSENGFGYLVARLVDGSID